MTLSFITVIKLKFQDASTKVQESFFPKLKSQYRYQKLNYLNTLAVIPNQYLINRKGGSRRNVKPRIPPHTTAKQGILFLRLMGYPARKKMECLEGCPDACLPATADCFYGSWRHDGSGAAVACGRRNCNDYCFYF